MSKPNAPVRVYRNLAEAVVTALVEIFENQRVAERVVDFQFRRNPKWGSRDRAFVADAIYEMVRWQRLLAAAVGRTDGWALLAGHLTRRDIALPAWPEFADFDADTIRQRLADESLPLAIRESVPDWLAVPPLPEWAERWPAELTAQNSAAPVTLRVNTLKSSLSEAASRLLAEGIDTDLVPGVPSALRLLQRKPLAKSAVFQSGLVEVQDAGSQLISPALRVEPGMHIIDGCAGAGGKTLHLAALLRNQGKIWALDVGEERLTELRRRAARAGATGIRTGLADAATRHQLAGWADRLLLDVPCSGSGTLRRQPDLKNRLTPAFVAEIGEVQRMILREYPAMLKPGGLLVYATCSLLPQEGEAVVRERLETTADLELLEEHRTWTAESGFDGFYFAVLRKRI
jgi:16S rRNA (cytosine967-C5)-methyltransferase